ncbi:MAG: substrate-binding domain-containing protein [Bacillota bacterium]
MVPKSLDNPVFLDAKEAAEKTAQQLGVVLEWVAPFNTDVNGQIEVIEGLIRRRVDGIAISCNDPERLRDVIDKAISAGIKVATFDADCPGSKRLFYCGTDNFRAGWACGEALIKIIRRRGLEKKRLRAAILTGGINAHNLNERIRGFCASVSGRLDLEYLGTMACDDDTIKGAELIEAFLRRHPENEVFFFAGTWPLFAPPESMPLYQEWCHRGGITVAIDTFYPVLQAAKKGMAQALVGQDFKKMGELTVRYLVRAIRGQAIPVEYLDTGLEYADWSNFDELLRTKKPWEMK